jgi:peptide/nickel transport system substrate-binding protein
VEAGAAEAMGDAFIERAVLTGPFKVERFQRDRELVAVRYDDYWGPPASVYQVIFTYLPDSSSRVLALQSGDIDIAVHVAPESVATLQSSSSLRVRPAALIALEFMYLNHRRGPWQDLRVRQAISMAIDRESLVNAVMQGQGAPATGPLPPAMLRCDQIQGHSYDPAQARDLLAQAGYQDWNGDGLVEKGDQALTMNY